MCADLDYAVGIIWQGISRDTLKPQKSYAIISKKVLELIIFEAEHLFHFKETNYLVEFLYLAEEGFGEFRYLIGSIGIALCNAIEL